MPQVSPERPVRSARGLPPISFWSTWIVLNSPPPTISWLKDIHCFNYGASISIGKVSGDIPAISEGALWLARGIAASLFIRDVDYHWEALLAYEKPELDGSEWTDADAPEPAHRTA